VNVNLSLVTLKVKGLGYTAQPFIKTYVIVL